jgi:spore maturation protein CgeB
MRYLIEHPEEVRRMGENARKTIEERFTLSHFIERMHTAITGVIA